MFLCILERHVVDVPFEPEVLAQPEVLEDLTVTPPVSPRPAIAARAEIAEVSHIEVAKQWVEKNAGQVARMIAQGRAVKCYEIQLDAALVPTLSAISEKPGGRPAAPPRQQVNIVNAAGDDVGSHILEP